LKKPEDYVCGVLEKLYAFRREHENVGVRIGISGRGTMPYYRIVHGAQDRDEHILGTFSENHKPLAAAILDAVNGYWSTKVMTFEEVQALRGKIPSRHGNRV
jgi:hypothetical protein